MKIHLKSFLLLFFIFLTCSSSPTGPVINSPRNIVFTADGNIFTISNDGTGIKKLTELSANHWNPEWSPDGTRILFSSDQNGPRDIYVVNFDGSNMIMLTDGNGFYSRHQWSPDGTKIAYTSGAPDFTDKTAIYIMISDGSQKIPLTAPDEKINVFRFSPDGGKIVYHLTYNDPVALISKSDIYIMNSDGSEKTRLTFEGRNLWANFSPAGDLITYVSDDFGPDPDGIYIMNVDGTGQTFLANGGSFPVFSPDGNKIVFSKVSTSSEIFSINTDGSDLSQLTVTETWTTFPLWSPDGEYIAYIEIFRDLFEIVNVNLMIMRIDGSEQEFLTNSSEWISYSFSPIW